MTSTYVGAGGESKSLRAGSTGVDQVDVVHLQVLGPGTEGGGLVVVETVRLALALGDGDLVRGIGISVGSGAVDGEGSLELLDIDLLLVGTGVDEDALS